MLACEVGGHCGVTAFHCGEDVAMFDTEMLRLADGLQMDVHVAIGLAAQLFDEFDHAGTIRPPVDGRVKGRIRAQPDPGVDLGVHDVELLSHRKKFGATDIRYR